MSTVGALIDRMYRVILEPPDAQPASTRLASNFSIGEDVFTVTSFDVPEDENLVRLGSIIEVNQELVRVTDFDVNTLQVTCLRGQLGTTEADHLADDTVKLSPPFPRVDAFNHIRDNIVALYPDLWTVRTEVWAPVGIDVYAVDDPLAVEVVEANPPSLPTMNIQGRIVDNHPQTDGRALVTNMKQGYGELWVRYRRRFSAATDESDVLADLGVEPVWETMVMVGAAADFMAGRDVPAAQTEWVQQVMEAESIRVGTRLSVAGGLAQYRDILMERFRKEMRGEDSNRVRVHVREVLA